MLAHIGHPSGLSSVSEMHGFVSSDGGPVGVFPSSFYGQEGVFDDSGKMDQSLYLDGL